MTGFTDAGALPYIEAAAGEVLDYSIDYAEVLADGESIDASSWVVPTGLTPGAATITTPLTTQWITGPTAGERYTITNIATTDQGRTYRRSFSLRVRAAI